MAFSVEVVIFDLDETLLDRTESLKRFCRWQAEYQCGLDAGQSNCYVSRFLELDENGAIWKDIVYEALVREFKLGIDVNDLLTTYLNHFSNHCTPKQGAPGAVEKLYGLGYRLALISNGKSPFQKRNFSALKLASYFDEVVVSDAVGCKKPDKQIFSMTCSRLGVDASSCVFVGDNPVADIQGASSAGMYTIYVPAYYGPSCPEADAICTDLDYLPSMVQNASNRAVKPLFGLERLLRSRRLRRR